MSQQDLVLENSDDIPMAMSVQSDVLEPQILTQKIAKFVLPHTGILSRDSVFQMQILTSTDKCFLPLNAGIYSAINRVDLMIGQQTIQSVNSVALYKAITHSYDTPAYRNNFTRIQKGINTMMKQNGTNINAGGSNVNAGLLIPAGTIINNFDPKGCTMAGETQIRNTSSKTPAFSIKISELFPLLDSIELPLFLINDPVSVVFHLNSQDNTNNQSNRKGLGNIVLQPYTSFNTPNTTGVTANIISETFLFYADYLYYTDERMFAIEESLNANKGMAKIYTDMIQIVNLQDTVGGTTNTNIIEKPFNFQIPVSNYQVKNVFLCWNPIESLGDGSGNTYPAGATLYNSLLGNYAMLNSVKPYSVQMRVNDELIFPQPLVSDALKAQEASYVYGSSVNLHTGLYSLNGCVLPTGNFSIADNATYYPIDGATSGFVAFGGMNLSTQLSKNMHFLGVNISTLYGDSDRDTELINQKPIEVFGNYPVNNTTNIKYNNYAFVEVTKLFAVKDGVVQLYDSVSQIQVQ